MRKYLQSLLIAAASALIILVVSSTTLSAQSVHVFADTEASLFDETAMHSEPWAFWSTERSSTPGYFSVTGDAFISGASAITGQLVDGYVKYYRGNSASPNFFTFPVGVSSFYRPVTISATIPANSSFATAWFAGDPSVTTDPTDGATHSRSSRGPGVLSVMDAGFWDWQTIAGTAPGMNITVNIPDVSASALAASLVLVGWNGTSWINLSGANGAGPYAGNWATSNAEGAELTGSWQPNITALAIGSSSFVLPLKLESFTGNIIDCKAELNWKTADEINTSHFTVQSSSDGTAWRSIARVAAQGNGNGKTYRFQTTATAQVEFYRLLMADLDGSSTYSATISLRSDCSPQNYLKALPNPLTTGNTVLKLIMQTQYSGKATVLIRTINGQLVSGTATVLRHGTNTVSVETTGLTPGTYILTVADEKGHVLFSTQKILKH